MKYLFLAKSTKRQALFELTVKVCLPSRHTQGFLDYVRPDGWNDTCFEVFLELYEVLVTFLEAVVSPHEFPDLASSDGSWNWDKDTRTKAQGLKVSLCSFQTLSVFITTKSILDEVKLLAVKLQKRD